MENKKFLTKIPSSVFIIWWSSSIKAQIKEFRESNDIDLEINPMYWGIIEFKLKKEWVEIDKSKYWKYQIYICKFKDWSKIDIIFNLWLQWETTEINWLKFRVVESVLEKKVELINNSELNEDIKNKHVKDIVWFLNNWYNITKK